MKKLYIFLMIIMLVLSACNDEELNTIDESLIEEPNISSDDEQVSVNSIDNDQANLEITGENGLSGVEESVDKTIINEYFYNSRDVILYDGYFEFIDVFKQDVTITYNLVVKADLFEIYQVAIEDVENVPQDRLLLGYFCVYSDTIYRFYTLEDAEVFMETGKITDNTTILFKTTAIEDTLGKEDKGLHQYIEVNDDVVEYHAYNNLIETGFYETYIWKQGYGLIFYQSGFGAGRESVVLELIME